MTGIYSMIVNLKRYARLAHNVRRRTHFRFGQLDVVIVERDAQPAAIYLENEDDGSIVEATANELAKAAAAVQAVLANPPKKKKK